MDEECRRSTRAWSSGREAGEAVDDYDVLFSADGRTSRLHIESVVCRLQRCNVATGGVA